MITPHSASLSPAHVLPRTAVLVLNHGSDNFEAHSSRLHAALRHTALQVVEQIDIRDIDRLARWIDRAPGERPMVVASGGDGTVGAVAGRVAQTGTTLGILPLGTHNDTARSLGIPRRIEDAVELLVSGKFSTVDAARFAPSAGEPRYFVQAGTLGMEVAFARLTTKASVRKRLGRFTYLVTTVRALRKRRPLSCDLIIDGRRMQVCLLYLGVFNAPIFGGPLDLRLQGASIDNRRLAVLAIAGMPLRRLLLAMVSILLGRTPRMRGVEVYQTSRLEVDCRHPLQVTLDGEIAGQVPGTFVLAPEALQVVTPWDFEDRNE